MAHRRLQLDPAFCPGSFNGSREITTRSLSRPGPFSGSREITTRSLFALVRSAVLGRLQLDPLSRFNIAREITTRSLVRISALGRLQLDPFFALFRSVVLGRLQLDPLSRLTFQGRLQLDPFFALRIARPFLDYCASVLCLPHFNYFAHRCFVFPLFLVSLYPLDCFLSPPLFLAILLS